MNTNENITLSKITVRLRHGISKELIGTGIIYSNSNLLDTIYILTAAHNLYDEPDSFTNLINDLEIDILNPNINRYQTLSYSTSTALINPDKDNDIAILLLDRAQVENILGKVPSVQILKSREATNTFIIKGFPAAALGQELVTIHPVWKQHMTAVDKFQLEMREDYDDWSMNGFSGSGAFLQTDNQAYLFGLFTRYREEGRGRIIYCQYIAAFNDLLNGHHRPLLTFTFFGDYGLSTHFFAQHISVAVNNLGPRFNRELNFRLPIAHIFNDLAKDNLFKKRLLIAFDRWLIGRNFSYYRTDHAEMVDIEEQYLKLREKTVAFVETLGWSPEQSIIIDPIVTDFLTFNQQLDEKRSSLFDLQYAEMAKQTPQEKKHYSYRPPYDEQIARVREIIKNNNLLLNDLSKINIKLSNNKCIVISGEAGCGKSHLLGDVATRRIAENKPTILLLGQLFKNTNDVWRQLLSQLHLTCTKEQLLTSLNNIGKQIGSRCLILIDALNEGAGKALWSDELAGFIEEVKRYPYIGLVTTVRTTYVKSTIPPQVRENPSIVQLTHEGFRGNEYEALRRFCEYFKLHQPNFPILAPEFANPLFLQLICVGVSGSGQKTFPQGFHGIIDLFSYYQRAISMKLSKKREEYELVPNLLQQAVDAVAEVFLERENGWMITLQEAIELFDTRFPRYKFILNDLIHENVFIQSSYKDSKNEDDLEVLYFSYERFADFFIALRLLEPLKDQVEVRAAFKQDQRLGKLLERASWYNQGLLEAMAVLLPEKFKLEIVEVYDWAFSAEDDRLIGNIDDWLNHFLLDSLKWRTLQSIDNDKLTDWVNGDHFNIDYHTFYNRLIELTTIPEHPFNSDRFFAILESSDMPERDAQWQIFFRYYSHNADDGGAFPLRRLIDWAWQPGISNIVDAETARLTGQTLAWVLSSTNCNLRDETTKAMVNLLQEQPVALLDILNKFENIDDLYIAERLMAVAYGCMLRTKEASAIASVAQYIYDTVFKDRIPPEHVLLRDYARNVVEFALYKKADIKIDVKCIRPPYGSIMLSDFPTLEEMKNYEIDNESAEFKENHGRLFNFIKFDILRWDFGEKTVDYAFSGFSPISFRADEEYKTFLKTLKPKQRAQLKLFESLTKTKSQIQSRKHSIGREVADLLKAGVEKNLAQIPAILELILTTEQYKYVTEKVIPYIINKVQHWHRGAFDTEPIKRWMVKRVHEMGYSLTNHTTYDFQVDELRYHGREKITTIGKKYQWIAFHQAFAIVADNYKMCVDTYRGKKFKFYEGPWQQNLRDINPSFITKKDDYDTEEDELIEAEQSPWWAFEPYHYWNNGGDAWPTIIQDLPDPRFVIERKDDSEEIWVYLNTMAKWEEPKPVGKDKYSRDGKDIWYLCQAYIIRERDKVKFHKWLAEQNFKGRWMPESHSANLSLFNRENYWSPAYKSEGEEKWKVLEDSGVKIMVASSEAVGELSEDKSGAHVRYEMPCQLLFEGMQLQYGDTDGEIYDKQGILVAFFTDQKGLLIRKKNLGQFLQEQGYEIFWTVLGEKRSLLRDDNQFGNFYSTISGYYYLDIDKITGVFNIITSDD
ncbi:AVAST type 2 anti-phage system protein Avs2 [Niastella sp. OAS944]|uniref:AVAST type 2 anti-phage system protein Avs2 n=1 Tax=Niastella sp. OAS944 TaxID=2664089 RepID=UPI00349AB781|nr:ABC-type oligopeptide transport system ATPase subunit [Chitinophagaceae bacterium OAS944]